MLADEIRKMLEEYRKIHQTPSHRSLADAVQKIAEKVDELDAKGKASQKSGAN